MQALLSGMLLHITMNGNHLFCLEVSFLTGLHGQFLGVGQDLAVSVYLLFQVQYIWDR